MLYMIHEATRRAIRPHLDAVSATRFLLEDIPNPFGWTPLGRAMIAGAEVFESLLQDRPKPEWGLDHTRLPSGRTVAVTPTVVDETPFCRLLRFEREGAPAGPKVLIAAPMSGHHATLLRGTVAALLPEHDVHVTDWVDARLVPASAGRFGLEDYVDHLVRFFRLLAPDLHVVAVCQPAPATLIAVSVMAGARDPAAPRSMVLMGGPVDVAANPTAPTRLAAEHPLGWFERHLIHPVPQGHPGAGRRVYPGFLQLGAFMSMQPGRHVRAHWNQFQHLVRGDGDSAEKHRRFYDEYLSVMDIPAEFYLDTIDAVFQRRLLARGELTHRWSPVNPAAIEGTGLMTVEGEIDDISAPGQTLAAHALCPNIGEGDRRHLLAKGVGHYGIFNGRSWRETIAPAIGAFIRR